MNRHHSRWFIKAAGVLLCRIHANHKIWRMLIKATFCEYGDNFKKNELTQFLHNRLISKKKKKISFCLLSVTVSRRSVNHSQRRDRWHFLKPSCVNRKSPQSSTSDFMIQAQLKSDVRSCRSLYPQGCADVHVSLGKPGLCSAQILRSSEVLLHLCSASLLYYCEAVYSHRN